MSSADTPPNSPIEILIVDDSDHDRRYCRRLLERGEANVRVTEAPDGPAALELLKADHFDIMIADLNMPGMDGVELIEAGQDYLQNTGVMILTGSDRVEPATRAIRLKVMDYLLKDPRDMLRETLLPRVRSVMKQVELVRENQRLGNDLRLRLAFLEQIHQQLPDVLFATLDSDGTLLELNPQAYDLLGLARDEDPVGQSVGEVLIHISDEVSAVVEDNLASRTPVRNLAVEQEVSSGASRILMLNLSPVEAAEAEPGDTPLPERRWTLTLRDITPERADAGDGGDRSFIFRGLAGRDPAMLEIRKLIRRVAPMSTSVLILGPTGSGKEVVARAIHAESDRSSKPFIAVNCTALSREILESELFGHVRGAFTGALQSRKGRFREADGGTLFLDEIGDTTESFQTKLLRVLEAGEIDPVGQDRPLKVDVRIICATNQDLEERVRDGRFREDLFYRINVVMLNVPRLSARPGDLPLLVDQFRREFNRKFSRSIQMISNEAMRALARHDWPGNVRELRHVLEYAFVVTEGSTIRREDLPEVVGGGAAAGSNVADGSPVRHEEESTAPGASDVDDSPQAADEIDRIKKVLLETGGNIGRAAKVLNIHRTTLWRKMRQFGIEG